MKKADFWIIAFVALLSLLPLPLLIGRADGVAMAVVTQRGKTIYEGPLSEDAVVTLDGAEAIIEDSAAWMRASDCPDGLCVRAGKALPGRPVVCLPNGVVISVTAGKEDALDAVAY